MSSGAAAAAETSISKAEFARRRGVTPGRVSQWIAERKIGGAALDGEGRNARIIEAIAVTQLRQKLDVVQMTGNGIGTRLDLPATKPAAPGDDVPSVRSAPLIPLETIEDKIKQERLESLRRDNRRRAEDEAERAGRLTDAQEASAQMRRIVAQVINVFEGALPGMATSIAAKWQLPQRDVLHLLRAEIRTSRAAAAAAMKETAKTLPILAEANIVGEEEPLPDAAE
ncbi:MAG: hypothetical protein EPO23_03315 [Xanthobacteraceae bacterium]|nr:MAG: hypothetical protein EPO23_03315 [Xanthobacteraceae bacterium]